MALTNDGRGRDVVLGAEVDKTAKAARADVAFLLAEAATTGRFDGMALDMQSAWGLRRNNRFGVFRPDAFEVA